MRNERVAHVTGEHLFFKGETENGQGEGFESSSALVVMVGGGWWWRWWWRVVATMEETREIWVLFWFFLFFHVGRRDLSLGRREGSRRALLWGFVSAPSGTGRPLARPRVLLPSHLDHGVEVVLRGRLEFEGRDAW